MQILIKTIKQGNVDINLFGLVLGYQFLSFIQCGFKNKCIRKKQSHNVNIITLKTWQ